MSARATGSSRSGPGPGYQAAVLAWLGADGHDARAPGRADPRGASAPGRGSASTRPVTIREADGSLGRPGRRAVGRDHRDGRRSGRSRRRCASSSRDGGRLVIPVGSRDRQRLIVVTRHGDEWLERPDGACVFVPLIGAAGFDGRVTGDRERTARYTRPRHDPRLRRAASRRRRALVRRADREPARARPERHDPDGLLG